MKVLSGILVILILMAWCGCAKEAINKVSKTANILENASESPTQPIAYEQSLWEEQRALYQKKQQADTAE